MTGIARSFDTMIDRAIAATITIAVAADRPPIMVMIVIVVLCANNGSASTVRSRSIVPGANFSSPAMASGTTKILISNR